MQKMVSDIPATDELADMADRDEDIAQFFTNTGEMKYPAQSMQIEFPGDMVHELDELASELHVDVQAVIITYLRQALDQHYLARRHGKRV